MKNRVRESLRCAFNYSYDNKFSVEVFKNKWYNTTMNIFHIRRDEKIC